eukprot:gene44760-27366_t
MRRSLLAATATLVAALAAGRGGWERAAAWARWGWDSLRPRPLAVERPCPDALFRVGADGAQTRPLQGTAGAGDPPRGAGAFLLLFPGGDRAPAVLCGDVDAAAAAARGVAEARGGKVDVYLAHGRRIDINFGVGADDLPAAVYSVRETQQCARSHRSQRETTGDSKNTPHQQPLRKRKDRKPEGLTGKKLVTIEKEVEDEKAQAKAKRDTLLHEGPRAAQRAAQPPATPEQPPMTTAPSGTPEQPPMTTSVESSDDMGVARSPAHSSNPSSCKSTPRHGGLAPAMQEQRGRMEKQEGEKRERTLRDRPTPHPSARQITRGELVAGIGSISTLPW